MPAPNGPQWVEVHRGFWDTHPDDVYKPALGRHWTTDRGIAAGFAENGIDDDNSTIISAVVHPRHIIKKGTPEWDKEAGAYDVDDVYGESEITIRPGAIVHPTGLIHLRSGNQSTRYINRKDIPTKELRQFRA